MSKNVFDQFDKPVKTESKTTQTNTFDQFDNIPQGHISNTDAQVTKEGYYMTPEQQQGLPAIKESLLQGVKGIPNGLLNFGVNTINDLGKTGLNVLTHPTGLLDMAGVAGDEIRNLPTNLLNSAINTPVAIYDKFTGRDYKPVVNLPSINDFMASDKLKQDRQQNEQMYPSGKLLGDLISMKPMFGGGALSNTAKVGGLGFFGSNSDLTDRITNAGTGSLLSGLSEGTGVAYKKGAPFVGNKFAGISNQSYNRALSAIDNNSSIFGKNFKDASMAVNREANNLKNMTPFDHNDIQNLTQNTIDSYSTGGGINPVSEAINPKLTDITRWLEESDLNQRANGSSGVNPADLHDIKSRLQEWSKYGDEPVSDYKGKPNELLKKLASNYNSKLRELNPDYAKANENFQDVMAAQEFNPLLKFENSPWGWVRIGSPLVGSAVNPLWSSLEFLSSPMAHKAVLNLYGSKSSPIQPAAYQSYNNNQK